MTARNTACPCGSGEKFKRCHGTLKSVAIAERADLAFAIARELAASARASLEQGMGRPIISAKLGETQFVAVGSELHFSKKWLTFHDFLIYYIQHVLGSEWYARESLGQPGSRHPVVEWSEHLATLTRAPSGNGPVYSAQMTGGAACFLHLAYDLYCLQHNISIQDVLIKRIRNKQQFWGARYEARAAASFARAGFTVEFEDETDRKRDHHEFSAVFQQTGKKFSVECKRRQPQKRSFPSHVTRIGGLLVRALSKQSPHDRIVFIDVNVPLSGNITDRPTWLSEALTQVRNFEGVGNNGKELPPAFVFLTNEPYEHFVDQLAPAGYRVLEGFKRSDYKFDRKCTLDEAILTRQQNPEIEALMSSLALHREVPSSMDGQSSHLAFGAETAGLIINSQYRLDNGQVGTLREATVAPKLRAALCVFDMEDGTQAMHQCPLSDGEIARWTAYPTTFFGADDPNAVDATSALDLYDFFLRDCLRNSRLTLLERLGRRGSTEATPNHELADELARRTTEAALRFGAPVQGTQ